MLRLVAEAVMALDLQYERDNSRRWNFPMSHHSKGEPKSSADSRCCQNNNLMSLSSELLNIQHSGP